MKTCIVLDFFSNGRRRRHLRLLCGSLQVLPLMLSSVLPMYVICVLPDHVVDQITEYNEKRQVHHSDLIPGFAYPHDYCSKSSLTIES